MNTLVFPRYPKERKTLPLSAKISLENYRNDELFQSIFSKPQSLPVDVLLRHEARKSTPQDQPKLIDAESTQAPSAAKARVEQSEAN